AEAVPLRLVEKQSPTGSSWTRRASIGSIRSSISASYGVGKKLWRDGRRRPLSPAVARVSRCWKRCDERRVTRGSRCGGAPALSADVQRGAGGAVARHAVGVLPAAGHGPADERAHPASTALDAARALFRRRWTTS